MDFRVSMSTFYFKHVLDMSTVDTCVGTIVKATRQQRTIPGHSSRLDVPMLRPKKKAMERCIDNGNASVSSDLSPD